MKLKYFFLFIALLTVIFALNYNRIYSYTCSNCHNPKKYSEQKEKSFHTDLECVSCHSKEGLSYWIKLFIPTIFQRANFYLRHHSVSILNCTSSNCHDTNRISISKKIPFNYNHKKHLDINFAGDKILCQNCHMDITHLRNYKSSKYICFLCHKISTPSSLTNCLYCHKELKMKKDHPDKNCDFCHIIEDSDIKVPEENCFNCHKKIRTNYDNFYELHTIHKKAKNISCFSCHNKTIHRK